MQANKPAIKPTESELEILRVLWDEQQATVRMVHEKLSSFKDAGYTTTLKLMQIMNEKGLVGRDDSGKTHIYFPLADKEKTQLMMLNKMRDSLFNGSSAQMVMQALGNQKPSKEEIEKIEALLQQYK